MGAAAKVEPAMSQSSLPDLFSVFAEVPEKATTAADAPAARPSSRPGVDPEALLAGLNPPQLAAVTHEGSPLLVVAGAGSGKTRVLTRRIAHLISQRNVHPGSVLAITFTNKAAAEMRGRVVDLVGVLVMWVSTFHSACVRIPQGHRPVQLNFSIYDDTDQRRLMTLVVRDQNLDTKRYPARDPELGQHTSELVDAGRAAEAQKRPMRSLRRLDDYQRRLRAANALDFDDLIMTTVELLQQCPTSWRVSAALPARPGGRYQDTNHAQYMLIKLLCGASI